MKITIGENIRRLRRDRDITQEQLAEAMNVSTAAVSKWERCESLPDITLLFPLAHYFEVSIDELMGYDAERINAQIEEILGAFSKQHLSGTSAGEEEAKRIITEAFSKYPNDCRVMSRYMWFIAGDMADNDPEVLLSHKEELLGICEKILSGCSDEGIRLGAWNMRAKILHAEGNTDEALEIYRSKFASWYQTCEQKSEQLFAKNTDEYYFWVRRNMYELFSFAADKLGRAVFFDKSLTNAEKTEKALLYGELMLEAYEKTDDGAFLVIAQSFLRRIENDLCYRGGTAKEIASVMELNLRALALLDKCQKDGGAIYDAVYAGNPFWNGVKGNLAGRFISSRKSAKEGRLAELLKDADYLGTLEKV